MKSSRFGLSVLISLMMFFIGCQPAEQPAERVAAGTAWKGQTHLVISAARANFPRLASWLFNGLYGQFPHREFTGEILFTASGYAPEIRNMQDGIAQLAVITPAATATMATKGIGLYSTPYPNLRGMFKIHQRDPMTLAVRADLGVTSFAEVVEQKIPLQITVGHQNGDDTTGFLFAKFLEAHGTSVAELESWGGKVLEVETSTPGIALLVSGEADAIFHEGVVLARPAWKEVNDKTPMRVLSISQEVIEKLGEYGFREFEQVIRKGSFPGVLEDVTTIDYSDWIVVGDASIPDDLAYKIAKVAVERIPQWVRQDPSLHTVESGEMGNMIPDPKSMWKDLGAPLHPGAERYFKEQGLMP